MTKVLILDANQRCSLACARSLGKKNIVVYTADELKNTLAGASRFSSDSFQYPSPYLEESAFIENIIREVKNRGINIIFPMTEITTSLLHKYKTSFPADVVIPLSTKEAYDKLNNKIHLFKLAQNIGIKVPNTAYIDLSAGDNLPDQIDFPVIIKPYQSRIFYHNKWIMTEVNYVENYSELEQLIKNHPYLAETPFMIQEYIRGYAAGIFTLYNNGTAKAFFQHKRLRERPPTGGVSVLSESIPVNQEMKLIAKKILDFVEWQGPAMVEFKVSNDGIPYIMEVNARFWGSLQLAIDSGIDFPYLLYKIAAKEDDIASIDSYKIGIKNRWLLGDLDHLYLSIFKGKCRGKCNFLTKLKILSSFLNIFDKNTKFEINRLDDIKPFFFELADYFKLK